LVVSGSGQKAHSRADGGEHALSLGDAARIIRRRLWVVLLVVVVLTGVAVGFTLAQTPTYEASARMLVQRQAAGDSPNLGGDIEGLQRLTKTLSEAVDSRPVAETVVEQLELGMSAEDLLDNLRVQQIPETQFIAVNYRDPSPERAQLVANKVGEVSTGLISEVSPDANSVTLTVWQPATAPASPASPNLKLNVLLALVVSTVLGLGLAFLLEYLGDGRRSPPPPPPPRAGAEDPSEGELLHDPRFGGDDERGAETREKGRRYG
jgi:capsular polysaccharide biosynthesis protein